jgi:hypothetical protein
MIRIPLSAIGSAEEFAAALEAHRADVEAHMMGQAGVPAPVGHQLIEDLVQRIPAEGPVAERGPDTIAILEYEVFDDSPPPPTLAERKQSLLMQVNEAAAAARGAVLSPARAELLNLEVTEAMSAPEMVRSPAQAATIELYTSFNSRCVDIAFVAAQAAVDIEQLTDSTIAAWQVPSFG